MAEESYYELLQVSENADQEIIQAAYRRLVLRYHPDRSSEPDAAEMTQRLNNAYAILSDLARRAAYNMQLGASRTAPQPRPRNQRTQEAPPARPAKQNNTRGAPTQPEFAAPVTETEIRKDLVSTLQLNTNYRKAIRKGGLFVFSA